MLAGFLLISSHETGILGDVFLPNLVDPLRPKFHTSGPNILSLAGYSLNLRDSRFGGQQDFERESLNCA